MSARSFEPSLFPNRTMSYTQKARDLGIDFPTLQPGYLNLCIRTGNLLITSGHVSDMKGVLGKDLSIEQGYAAARECAVKILQSVHHAHGTLDDLRVIKRNQEREPLKREKLLAGMVRACEKRPVPIDVLEAAGDEILNELTAAGMKEIPTRMIGPKVIAKLKGIDSVAFVRYASVYRQFQDVGEFIDEIESLEREPVDPRLQPELFEAGQA